MKSFQKLVACRLGLALCKRSESRPDLLTHLLLLGLVVSFETIASTSGEKCHRPSDNFHLYLATKTPYRVAINKDDSPLTFEGCDVQKIWMLIRHGTRNPGKKMIRKMTEFLPELRDHILNNHLSKQGKLCQEDVLNFKQWSPRVEETEEKHLTFEGEDEMIELAERFQKRFPKLFPETYSNSSHKFRYTATQRTEESAKFFTIGLFGRKVSKYVWYPEALHQDPVLRFYKLCSRWRMEVDKNPESLLEKDKFIESLIVLSTLENVSKRLGFNNVLNFENVHLMYMTCAFETAWYKHKTSPWCTVFSDRDLKVMEYIQDLEYYWIDGYGFDLTYKQACPAFRDMIHFLKDEADTAINNATTVAYFTHSGTMLKMLAHLGLYQDGDALRHDNFETTSANRKWRVGVVDSFAANLAFVLFQCGGDKKVLTLHQERPVTLRGCPEGDLCPLEVLTDNYVDSIHSCDFHEMCSVPTIAA